MRFEVDEEATALRDAAGAILDGKATPDIVRAGWPGGEYERVRVIWRKLADSGAVGALVPPTSGGLGLDANCLVPLLERIGRSGLPVPAVETIAVAAPLMAEVGYPQLPAVLAGELLVTAQLGGGDLVPFGQHADLVLLRKGNSIRIHQRADLVLEPVVTIDGSRALARLVVTPGDGIVVADGLDSVERAWRAGVLGTSALLIGLADRLLDMTVGYVKEREQFGSPIGSFQAIKHALTSRVGVCSAGRVSGWLGTGDELRRC
jgi:alkylation response protein AidB-like acyl-CoA dehydrogenase